MFRDQLETLLGIFAVVECAHPIEEQDAESDLEWVDTAVDEWCRSLRSEREADADAGQLHQKTSLDMTAEVREGEQGEQTSSLSVLQLSKVIEQTRQIQCLMLSAPQPCVAQTGCIWNSLLKMCVEKPEEDDHTDDRLILLLLSQSG